MSAPVLLMCLVYGQPFARVFDVEIERGKPVSALKRLIKAAKQNEFDHIDANILDLYQVEIPITDDETPQNPDLSNNTKLQGGKKVSTVFQVDPREDVVHIIIKVSVLEGGPLTKRRRLNESTVLEGGPLTKRRCLNEDWKNYSATCGQSVELPQFLIDMLIDNTFVPEPRSKFLNALQNAQPGHLITMPDFGDCPKGFGEGYLQNPLVVTQQMVDMWEMLSANHQRPIKRVLSGPMGVGKSYLALFLASKAYSENWPVLYIANASVLNTSTEEETSREICHHFLSVNKDILTAAELTKLVNHEDTSKPLVVSCASTIFCHLLKNRIRKTLLVIDEHGALFMNDPPAPAQLPVLNPLMSLTFWGERAGGACVVLTGTAHATFERKYLKDDMQGWVEFVGPLPDNAFDSLLRLHPFLGRPNIAPKVKRITNCVPRELIYLDKYVSKSPGVYIPDNEVDDSIRRFRASRRNEFLKMATNYTDTLSDLSFMNYRKALSVMFLRQSDISNLVDFDWKFMDTGLVYRFKEDYNSVIFKPLCPAALDALLGVYKALPLPSDITVASIRDGEFSGDQFEEVLFRQLLRYSANRIAFKATNLTATRVTDVHIKFEHFYFLEKGELAPEPHHSKSLIRGFPRYPRFDFILGRMFIQVSLSSFDKHNTGSAMIDLAFAPYSPDDRRNQIEIYLDTTFGPTHKAKLSQGRFTVTRNGVSVPDFRVVYIRGKPGMPHHPHLVNKYKDLAFINYDEVKTKLCGDFLR
ncbi:hypothetical protein BGX38DRAFT_1258218 [Terfezia claveryi]|nr:hypothetical protein BGX38DRAFT_1258218 [Terfezia claveryi]